MSKLSRVFNHAVAAMSILALVGATSCVPDAPSTPEVPEVRAVLSPASGPAGSYVNVAVTSGACDPSGPYHYSSLQASITMASTGIVIASGYQYISSSPSTYATPDPYVRLRIPTATRVGVYNVFLSCYSYLDTYAFAPAKFTVTSSGL